MKKISILLVALTMFSCKNTDKSNLDEARQTTIDSMELVIAKQKVIDSMNSVKPQKEVVIVNQTTTQPATQVERKKMSSTAKGALIGAGVGAATGAIVSKKKGEGAIIGGLAGAGVGAGTGAIIDSKKKKE